MIKITLMGAGSTVFAKNVIGDCMCCEALRDATFALYDIDKDRLDYSYDVLMAVNKNINNSRATILKYHDIPARKDALRDANFVINAIQVGFYKPCTVTDFEIPKKYGLKQTIGDTIGIGGIMRALRTIPVLKDFANDMEEVCPDAWFLNYTNPMAILTGYMQRYTKIKTVGLCHSVQKCSESLLERLDMKEHIADKKELIAGINHMAWLLEIKDKDGKDLYPEIKKRAKEKNKEKHGDMVRFDYIDKLGFYCTESSEHNAEYSNFYIKDKYPELIENFAIPIDEYLRRCRVSEEKWDNREVDILENGEVTHERSIEYASYIMEAMVTDVPYRIGGNVMNTGLIENLPTDACVEVPCMVDRHGINPCHVGRLPVQLAGMNLTNIPMQLMTIEAAVTQNKEDIYRSAMLDPHTSSTLSIDDIISMCDELIQEHGEYMEMYK